MKTGIVFDIKEFAVFDGPGVRTTVFMKGCPLHCQWCHNPEGLASRPQLMVSQAACIHCGACQAACPHPESCSACGKCIPYCKGGLRKISGEEWTAEKLAERLKKDSDLYEATGGGITFSGGEPLLQWDFVKETIFHLPHIHTAIETSSYASDETFLDAIETCDLILMDWKVSDPALHKHYTGVDQAPIRRHLEMLAKSDTPFFLRMPIIPGVNDNQVHFEEAARLVEAAKNLCRVDILPYQKTAGAKYEMIGKRYAPDFQEEKPLRFFTEAFSEKNIPFKLFQ